MIKYMKIETMLTISVNNFFIFLYNFHELTFILKYRRVAIKLAKVFIVAYVNILVLKST